MSTILIAGGGLAGAAAATRLAQAGRGVTLFEREAAPVHKICGEFLSAEAQAYLRQLGLDVAGLGGHRITHLRLARGRHLITAPLPFQGLGLTRRTLDEALLRHAERAGATVHRGQTIRHISRETGISVEVDGHPPLRPSILLLATGKHEARGAARRAEPSSLVGFKTYFRLAPSQHQALAGHVELMLFPGGYAGLQRVEDGQANFCVLVEAALLRGAGGNFPALLAQLQALNPHLATRLTGAAELLAAPLSIAWVPYGFIHRPAAADSAGIFRLGDQAAVIPSFTGDGMAIALHSAALAAQSVLRGEAAAGYHRRLASDLSGQIRRATVLHRLVAAPYLGAAMFGAAMFFPSVLAASAALTRVPPRFRLTF
jgi:flavin-dependent dehydrogenase